MSMAAKLYIDLMDLADTATDQRTRNRILRAADRIALSEENDGNARQFWSDVDALMKEETDE